MTRRKIRLAWIGNDTSRKASFKKRRAGLLKKVRELSTLCGVSAFIIIYGPGESDPPAVWPSVDEARQLYERFTSVPDMERCKKMVNQEGYLRERAAKMAEQLKKQHRRNKEKLTGHIMRQVVNQGKALSEFETSELNSVLWVLEEKMKEIKRRIDYYDQTVGIQPPGSILPPPIIPMEELLVGSPGDHQLPWESIFMNNNNANNNLIIRGVDHQGNSTMGMQIPDQHQYFLGGPSHGTTSLGTNNFNTVQPYYGGGSSSSGGGGNGVGFQPYGSHVFNHGSVNNHYISNINNINVTSTNQMGLGNFGYFGSGGGGNQFISGGFSDMGNNLAAHQVNLGGSTSTQAVGIGNIGSSSSTTLQNPNYFGHNIGSGGVNENLGFGVVQSGQNNMGENNNNFGIANNLQLSFNGGNNAGGHLGQAQENNQVYQSNNGGINNVMGNMPSGLFGTSGGSSAGGDGAVPELTYDFTKNWPGLYSAP